MGPAEKQPPVPDMEWMRAPETHRFCSKTLEEANYLQALEGGIDSVHSSFLHNNDLSDKARYRSAMASLRQQQTRLQQIEQNLLVNVRTAVRAVDTNRQSVEIVAKATELAQRQYELELARFKAGLSTSRQVLQTQDDLETARVNELQAIVNLRTAVANLHQLDSTSIARFHVAVQ